MIVAPEADANAIHAAIPGAQSDGQGGFTLPCTSTSKVALSFAGQSFTIDPRDLAFQPQTQDTKGTCVSGISAGSIGGKNQWLVGDVFLKVCIPCPLAQTRRLIRCAERLLCHVGRRQPDRSGGDQASMIAASEIVRRHCIVLPCRRSTRKSSATANDSAPL